MDIELLEAIYRNHPSSERSNFLATCYAIMGRCGMVKGFRKHPLPTAAGAALH